MPRAAPSSMRTPMYARYPPPSSWIAPINVGFVDNTAATPTTVNVTHTVDPVTIPATAANACFRERVAIRRIRKMSGPGDVIPTTWMPNIAAKPAQFIGPPGRRRDGPS